MPDLWFTFVSARCSRKRRELRPRYGKSPKTSCPPRGEAWRSVVNMGFPRMPRCIHRVIEEGGGGGGVCLISTDIRIRVTHTDFPLIFRFWKKLEVAIYYWLHNYKHKKAFVLCFMFHLKFSLTCLRSLESRIFKVTPLF